MSTPRTRLIEANMIKPIIDDVANFVETVQAYEKLSESKAFREVKPRLLSTYRYFDSVTGVLLSKGDVDLVKNYITRLIFTGGTGLTKQVYSPIQLKLMGDSELNMVRKNKQAVFVQTDIGKEYMEAVLQVESAYNLINKRVIIRSPWATYTANRLSKSMMDARYAYYQTGGTLGSYVEAMRLFLDFIGNPGMLLSDLVISGSYRDRSVELTSFQSEENVVSLVKGLQSIEMIKMSDIVLKLKSMPETSPGRVLLEYLESFESTE